jgi:ribose transport system permease protein
MLKFWVEGNKMFQKGKNKNGSRIKFMGKDTLTLLCTVAVFSVLINIINPKFFTFTNLTNILQQVSVCGVLASGMTFVLITGGIDLSAGYGVTFGAIVIGNVFLITNNSILAIAAGLVACTLLGCINGFIISTTKIVPFVVTLATMSLTQGVLNLLGAGKRLNLKDYIFEFIGRTKIFGFSFTTVIMVIVLVIFGIILSNTKLGNYTYAIGSNENNARITGLPVNRCKVLIYTMSGFCMGISSILLGARTVLVTQNSGGSSLLMDTLAAVILGGTSTAGGIGKMSGTFVGVIMLGMISNTLTLLKVPSQSQDLFKGVVILIVLLFQPLSKMYQQWKTRYHRNKLEA